MSGTAPYYTQALSPLPDRCFRLVASQGEAGPTHCPEPVAWRGSWRAPNGRRYRVEACEGSPTATSSGQRPYCLASRRVVAAGAPTTPKGGRRVRNCSRYVDVPAVQAAAC
jgi:hypothetical protein